MARPRSDIKDRLVQAARERFLLQGVDGASLREIAADARTGIGMVYYYFPAKDDLFLAVVEDSYAALLGGIQRALQGSDPAPVRLERLLERIWRLDDAEFTTLRLVLREALISSARVRKLAARFLHGGHIPLLLGTLAEGMSSGELRADLPPLVLLGTVMSLVIMPVLARRTVEGAVRGLPFPPLEEMPRLLASVLLQGIAAPAGNRLQTAARAGTRVASALPASKLLQGSASSPRMRPPPKARSPRPPR